MQALDDIYTDQQAKKIGIKMLIITIICCICSAIPFSWGVISDDIIKANGWNNFQVTVPFTISSVVNGIASMIVGSLADGKKLKKALVIASIIYGIGVSLLALFSKNWIMVCISLGFILGACVSFSVICLPTLVMKWMPHEDQSKAAGFSTVGLSLNGVIIPAVYTFFTGKMGFSAGLCTMGILFSAICVCCALLIKSAPQSYVERNLAAAAAKVDISSNDAKPRKSRTFITPYPDKNWKESLKTPPFILIFLTFTFTMIGNVAVSAQVVTIIKSFSDIAIPPWLFVSIGSSGGIFGRLLGGIIGDRFGIPKSWAIVCAVYGISFLLFPFIKNTYLLLILYFIIQYAACCSIAYCFALCGIMFSKSCTGTITGIANSGYGVGALIGPTLASLLADSTGSYTVSFIVFGIVSLIAAGLQFALERWAVKSSKSRNLIY